jgi:hypothetical protein
MGRQIVWEQKDRCRKSGDVIRTLYFGTANYAIPVYSSYFRFRLDRPGHMALTAVFSYPCETRSFDQGKLCHCMILHPGTSLLDNN